MTSSKLAAILLMALYLPAAWAQAKKVSTAEDARIYREAMVWFKKAEALIGQAGGDEAPAISLVERIVSLDKTDAEALLGLAVLYQKQSRLDEAAVCYRQLLEIEPRSFAGHFNLGLIRWKQGKTREAIAE